ncbi:MAG: GGDEF domain-containing protein [Treponema sp.]|nr:GGDEF domain-containing protein [Treponema sp.]
MINFLTNSNQNPIVTPAFLVIVILVLISATVIINLIFNRRFVISDQTKLMMDTTPLCCQLWDSNLRTVDCNEAAVRLYGFQDKKEYVERFFECSPEFQPDGQRSDEKAIKLVKKAFEDGYCNFEWMHQMPVDKAPLPAEVTLVRVNYKGGYVVAGYTRDLRDIASLERQISWLRTEAEKIYFDPLTGIYNRRFFDENMNHLIKLLSRSGGVLSMLMIDIDCFKKYNDKYGHIGGDDCLKLIAETLSKNLIRSDDFVARYGGEEFVVVLPNTDEKGARLIAEKLLLAIFEKNVPHEENLASDRVTISIGVTTGKANYTQNSNDYIKRADEMMYISKNNGRNQFTFGHL